jgi:hypothetical protein
MIRVARFTTVLVVLVGTACLPAVRAQGGTTVWTIDSGMSSMTLAIPQQPASVEIAPGPPPLLFTADFRAANQGDSTFPWSVGNTSALAGTIRTSTNYKTMIDFLGGTHNIDGQVSGSFQPLVGGGDGSAPADFGGTIQWRAIDALPEDPWEDVILAAIRDVLYDIDSGVVPVSGGTFPATSLTVGALSASLDFRGVGFVGSMVTPGTAVIPASSAPNTAASASIAIVGSTATLTIPIDVPLAISASGVDLVAAITGTIVATNTLPIPGDANMDGAVNIFDINLVSANWNGPPPDGDVNYDGMIDIFDINLISANWSPTGGAATAVPEPTTLLLAVCGGLMLAGIARRTTVRIGDCANRGLCE